MRIRVLSDLHIEFGDWTPPPVEADVIVLAGDIHCSSEGLYWARGHFPDVPVIYVAGNHEFYHRSWEREMALLRKEAKQLEIHFLENDAVVIDDVRFLGATLWTDFKLNGADPRSQARAKSVAASGMSDFQVIGYHGRRFQPDDAQTLCQQSVDWLEAQLEAPFGGSTIVVTHHLPHERCINAKYAGSDLNPAFASHLLHLVRHPVRLWIHGHTHDSVAFTTEGTRVVCNPRGYAGYELNPGFDPGLVIDIAEDAAQGISLSPSI